MFTTTQDILNIALAGGFVLLVIFLSVVLIYLILILRDVCRITNRLKDTAQKVNEYVLKPVKMLNSLISKAQPIMEMVEDKIKEKTRSRPKRRRKS